MSLPLKKRKVSVPLQVKVDRIQRQLYRQRPDLQYAAITATLAAGITGYNEWLIDLLPADVLDNVTGDFFIEAIHMRVHTRTSTGFTTARADILDSIDGGITGIGSNDPNQYLPPKLYKTFASNWLAANDANSRDIIELKCKPKMLVTKQGTAVVRHHPYAALRMLTTAAGASTRVDILVAFREK